MQALELLPFVKRHILRWSDDEIKAIAIIELRLSGEGISKSFSKKILLRNAFKISYELRGRVYGYLKIIFGLAILPSCHKVNIKLVFGWYFGGKKPQTFMILIYNITVLYDTL